MILFNWLLRYILFLCFRYFRFLSIYVQLKVTDIWYCTIFVIQYWKFLIPMLGSIYIFGNSKFCLELLFVSWKVKQRFILQSQLLVVKSNLFYLINIFFIYTQFVFNYFRIIILLLVNIIKFLCSAKSITLLHVQLILYVDMFFEHFFFIGYFQFNCKSSPTKFRDH
jgi:hypothetical protein